MHRSYSRFALHPVILFFLITFGCSLSAAQEPEKPDAPQGPVEQNLRVIPAQAPYRMISGNERIAWATVETFGPHWDGFAKRYGMRFTGTAASNTIEAGLGAIWGEDPRYVRNPNLPFKRRIGHVFLLSVAARDGHGNLMPAYARYIAIPGNNFLSNTWRVSSDSTTSAALTRTAYGVLGKITSNAWSEFWPDVKRHVFKRQ